MNDELIDLVGALAPEVTAEPAVLARVRSTLMTTIDETEPTPTPEVYSLDRPPRRQRRRRRRIVSVAAIAVVLAGATGTAWAVLANRGSADTTNLSCPTPIGPHSGAVDPNAQTIAATVTGNPVTDCTEVWATLTTAPAPKMTAYDNGDGAVVVLAADAAPPPAYTELTPGNYQDAKAAALQRELDDVATGLGASCDDFDAASTRVHGILQRLGLKDWSVTQGHPGRVADGKANCAAAGVDAATRSVMIVGAGPAGDEPFRPFAAEVHRSIEKSCVGTDDAAKLVREIAARTTVANGGTPVDLGAPDVVAITIVEDASASCTDVTVTVGGNVAVTLVGPR